MGLSPSSRPHPPSPRPERPDPVAASPCRPPAQTARMAKVRPPVTTAPFRLLSPSPLWGGWPRSARVGRAVAKARPPRGSAFTPPAPHPDRCAVCPSPLRGRENAGSSRPAPGLRPTNPPLINRLPVSRPFIPAMAGASPMLCPSRRKGGLARPAIRSGGGTRTERGWAVRLRLADAEPWGPLNRVPAWVEGDTRTGPGLSRRTACPSAARS